VANGWDVSDPTVLEAWRAQVSFPSLSLLLSSLELSDTKIYEP